MTYYDRTTPLRAAQPYHSRGAVPLEDFEEAQVGAAAAYLRALMARPRPCSWERAGTLKASAERWAGFYIGATALVAAAQRLGLQLAGPADGAPEEAVDAFFCVPDTGAFAREQFDRQRRNTTRTSELFWPDWNAPRWRKVSGEWLLIH